MIKEYSFPIAPRTIEAAGASVEEALARARAVAEYESDEGNIDYHPDDIGPVPIEEKEISQERYRSYYHWPAMADDDFGSRPEGVSQDGSGCGCCNYRG